MNETLDSASSYCVVVIAGAYSWLMDASSDILTVGSLILLGIRLWVDGRRLWKSKRDE